MAPLLGPDANSRTVHLRPGQSAWGRTATVYTNAAATSLAAILAYDGTGTPGAAVSGSAVTVDADSRIPLVWFPDGYDVLYARINGSAVVWKLNADFDARIDALVGGTAAAAVADQGALTASAPSALTATAPAALTSAQITGGESPTEAEHNQTQADIAALRTTVAALVVDVTALRATVAAAVVDLAAARTKLNAELAALRTAGLQST